MDERPPDTPQIGVDDWGDRYAPCKGRGRLRRPPQGADVDGVNVLRRQSLADALRLLFAFRREGGVALAVQQLERRPDYSRLGLAVANEEDLSRPRGRLEPPLADDSGLVAHAGTGRTPARCRWARSA